MLTRIRGTLQSVSDETATLLIDPFEIEVLIGEHTRRTIQTKLGEPSRSTPSSISKGVRWSAG